MFTLPQHNNCCELGNRSVCVLFGLGQGMSIEELVNNTNVELYKLVFIDI